MERNDEVNKELLASKDKVIKNLRQRVSLLVDRIRRLESGRTH